MESKKTDMKIKITFCLTFLISVSAFGQQLYPGFDKNEYKQNWS